MQVMSYSHYGPPESRTRMRQWASHPALEECKNKYPPPSALSKCMVSYLLPLLSLLSYKSKILCVGCTVTIFHCFVVIINYHLQIQETNCTAVCVCVCVCGGGALEWLLGSTIFATLPSVTSSFFPPFWGYLRHRHHWSTLELLEAFGTIPQVKQCSEKDCHRCRSKELHAGWGMVVMVVVVFWHTHPILYFLLHHTGSVFCLVRYGMGNVSYSTLVYIHIYQASNSTRGGLDKVFSAPLPPRGEKQSLAPSHY